jgi:hypothetical protein
MRDTSSAQNLVESWIRMAMLPSSSAYSIVTHKVSRAARILRFMNGSRWVEFDLPPTAMGLQGSVRLGDFDERWVAVVRCESSETFGLGGTARQALLAALAPLGPRATTAVMADPTMFAASAALLAHEAAV